MGNLQPQYVPTKSYWTRGPNTECVNMETIESDNPLVVHIELVDVPQSMDIITKCEPHANLVSKLVIDNFESDDNVHDQMVVDSINRVNDDMLMTDQSQMVVIENVSESPSIQPRF